MSDGDLNVAEVVGLALELGVEIGISDHVSTRNRELFVSTSERLEKYCSVLEAAPVFRSAELCWCDPFSAGLTPEVLERFDYVIGSNHGFPLPDGTFATPWWQTLPAAWQGRPQEVMEVMVDNLCNLVASMPITIIGHPTFMPAALLAIEPDVHAWWTDEREDRFIAAAVRHGVALEISNRYRLPHPRFLIKARQAGAHFTLGSDGHHFEQIGQLDWAVEAALAAGIGGKDLFVAQRKGR
jgi:histidinol phosphatase-like PHP family hydrolase